MRKKRKKKEVNEGEIIGILNMREGMIEKMNIIEEGRECGNEGKEREEEVKMEKDIIIRREEVLKNVIDEIDEKERDVELVEESKIGREGRGEEKEMKKFEKNILGLKKEGIEKLLRDEMGMNGLKIKNDGDK